MTICGPLPPPTTDNAVVLSDYAGLSPVNDLSAYRDVFLAAPGIALTMDYSNLPSDVRAAIWARFDAAETDGDAGTVALPAAQHLPYTEEVVPDLGSASYNGGLCDITRAECVNIVAAAIAHMFYHEVHTTFPWRIIEYTTRELEGLFNVQNLIGEFADIAPLDWAGVDPIGHCVILGHSPNDTYAIASINYLPATSHSQAVENLIVNLFEGLVHAGFPGSNSARWSVTPGHMLNVDPDHVSRRGCHTSAELTAFLYRSFNIPATREHGRYAAGHSQLEFPSIGKFLGHGDDYYSKYLTSCDGLKRLDELEDWLPILAMDRLSEDTIIPSLRLHYLKAMKYIPDSWITDFTRPTYGWESILSVVDPYFDAGEQWSIDRLYSDLAQITGTDGYPTLENTNRFPVKIDPGYTQTFINTDAVPLFLVGEYAGSAIGMLSPNDSVEYLNDLVSRGFNAVYINLLERHFTTNTPTDVNYSGASPFETTPDYFWWQNMDPPTDYITNAQSFVAAAKERSVLVIAAILRSGLPGEGWLSAIQDAINTEAVLDSYASRMISWFLQGDHNMITLVGDDVSVADMATGTPTTVGAKTAVMGAATVGGFNQQMFLGTRGTTLSDYWDVSAETWISSRGAYGDETVYLQARTEYEDTPALPTTLLRGVHENDPGVDALMIRRQSYLAWLNGAVAGVFYGNANICDFDTGWETALDDEGRNDMKHLLALARSREWWKLVPSYDASILTSSRGTTGLDWTTVALTDDAKTLVVYTAAARDLSIDTTVMDATDYILNSYWFDPSDGSATWAGTWSNVIPKTWLHPGNNAAGDPDWVLVIDDAFANFGNPG